LTYYLFLTVIRHGHCRRCRGTSSFLFSLDKSSIRNFS